MSHKKEHSIDNTNNHAGVSGATENNLVSFDANGLPKDSGKASVNVTTTSFGITIDGGTTAITAGLKGFIRIPFNCTIKSWAILADVSGSISIDLWKDTYINFPPTDADSILGLTATAPNLSSQQKNYSSDLTDWTTTVNAGDIIAFNVDSSSTVKRIHLIIEVEKS